MEIGLKAESNLIFPGRGNGQTNIDNTQNCFLNRLHAVEQATIQAQLHAGNGSMDYQWRQALQNKQASLRSLATSAALARFSHQYA